MVAVEITAAAHVMRTHTMLEVYAYGGHFGKQSCTYYSFIKKVMCKKYGAERPTSHFGDHVGCHFGEKVAQYYSFVTKVICTTFGAERPTYHFSQGRPLDMVAILVTILENKA